jgi:L-fuculose-phosphate aldolase
MIYFTRPDKKTMSEKYTGVKFKTIFEGSEFTYEKERRKIITEIKNLGSHSLLDRNNGNISVKVDKGIVITPTGKEMAELKESDMVLVTAFDGKETVKAVGDTSPSSEARMHWMIYQEYDVGAVLHFHDSRLLGSGKFPETDEEHPYGTMELAQAALKALKESKIIILKNHGVLVVDKDLSECHQLVEEAEKLVN